MQADDHLKALFAHDLPAARDVVFQEAVRQGLERRLLWQDISVLAAGCVAGAVFMWMLMPVLESWLIGFGRLITPGLVMLVLGAIALGFDHRRTGASEP